MTKRMFSDIFDSEILPFIQEMQQNNTQIQMKDIQTCKEDIYQAYSDLNRHLKK